MKTKHENQSKHENYRNELTVLSIFEFLLFGLFILVFKRSRKCSRKVFIGTTLQYKYVKCVKYVS